MEGYNFSTEIVVRFAETDAQGIAHHAGYVVWLEVARIAYLAEHAGGYGRLQHQGIEALTTEVHLHYDRPARFDERVRIWTRCVDLRGARFRCEYVLECGGDAIATGHTSHATVNAVTHRPTRLPEWFLEAVATAEA